MRRVLLEKLPEPGRPSRVPEAEARHLMNVLRLQEGEQVEAIDGRGQAVVAQLRVAGAEAWLDFAEARGAEASGRVALRLELALLKADAMSWVIEKAVELGVDSLVPVSAEHCVVKIKGKSPAEFQERWQRIADQALKQCGRRERMTIEEPRPVAKLAPATPAEPRIFCDEAARGKAPGLLERLSELNPKALSVIIGPEGGWSLAERSHLAAGPATFTVGLGPNVLRAETAALFAVSVVAAGLRLPAGLADLSRKF